MHNAFVSPDSCTCLEPVHVRDRSSGRQADPDTWRTLSASHLALVFRGTLLYWPGGRNEEFHLPEVEILSAPDPVTICPRALRRNISVHWCRVYERFNMRVRSVVPSSVYVVARRRASCPSSHRIVQTVAASCIAVLDMSICVTCRTHVQLTANHAHRNSVQACANGIHVEAGSTKTVVIQTACVSRWKENLCKSTSVAASSDIRGGLLLSNMVHPRVPRCCCCCCCRSCCFCYFC